MACNLQFYLSLNLGLTFLLDRDHNTNIARYIFCISVFLLFSCEKEKIDPDKEKQNIIQTDIDFSKMSEEEGMKKAFLFFADEDAVLLRANSFPVEGKEKIGKSFTEFSDSGFVLTWKPLKGFISESADLGYTYGTFTSVINNLY